MPRSVLRAIVAVTVALIAVGVVAFTASTPLTFGNNPVPTPTATVKQQKAAASISFGQYEPTAEEKKQARPLGEIGPGACWPQDERYRDSNNPGDKVGFAGPDGPKEAANWLRQNPAVAKRLDAGYSQHPDYYLLTEVVPDWYQLDPVERVARYTAKLSRVLLPAPMRLFNTYCKGSQVVPWEVQIFPKDEPVNFVPGHEPGTKDVRPVQKGVCGNLLPPPPPRIVPTPTPTTTARKPTKTPTSTPTCTKGNRCNPTPRCTKGSQKPECLEAKHKNGGSGSRGNSSDQEQGKNPPATKEPRPQDPPSTPYDPPDPPQPEPTQTTEPAPPPPPDPEPTEPYDPCKDNPSHPACG